MAETHLLPIAPGNTNTILVRDVIRIGLFDGLWNALPNVAFKIVLGDQTILGTSDGEGIATVYASTVPDTCTVSWCSVPIDGDGEALEDVFEHTLEVCLVADFDDSSSGVRSRLTNLGYCSTASLEDCVRAFQGKLGLTVNGDAEDTEMRDKLFELHQTMDLPKPIYEDPLLVGDLPRILSDTY